MKEVKDVLDLDALQAQIEAKIKKNGVADETLNDYLGTVAETEALQEKIKSDPHMIERVEKGASADLQVKKKDAVEEVKSSLGLIAGQQLLEGMKSEIENLTSPMSQFKKVVGIIKDASLLSLRFFGGVFTDACRKDMKIARLDLDEEKFSLSKRALHKAKKRVSEAFGHSITSLIDQSAEKKPLLDISSHCPDGYTRFAMLFCVKEGCPTSEQLGGEVEFVSCGPFCATADYCKTVAETILADVFAVLLTVATIIMTAGSAGVDHYVVINLVGKIISIMQKTLHHKCPSEGRSILDWSEYKKEVAD